MMTDSQLRNLSSPWRGAEAVLWCLYQYMPYALRSSASGVAYAIFVNALREQIHPPGLRDVRAVEWKSGTFFSVDLGDRYGCEFHYGYAQERFEAQLFRELLAPGSIVFDVGANFGFYTILSALAVAPAGKVYAFEPVDSMLDLLVENVRANKAAEVVTCHSICIGATDGQTEFFITENASFSGMAHTQRSRLVRTKQVQMRSIDSLIRDVGLSRIDALKIDVEGFEYAVLSGAMETIRRSPEIAIMLEISSKNLTPERKISLESSLENVFALGFRAWSDDVNSGGMRVYDSCAELVGLPSVESFLVLADSAREKQLLEAYARVKDSFKAKSREDASQALDFVLGKEILNLFETSRAQSDALNKKVQRQNEEIQRQNEEIQRQNEEIQRQNEEIQRWQTASLFDLLKYRYGPSVKRKMSALSSPRVGGRGK